MGGGIGTHLVGPAFQFDRARNGRGCPSRQRRQPPFVNQIHQRPAHAVRVDPKPHPTKQLGVSFGIAPQWLPADVRHTHSSNRRCHAERSVTATQIQ